MFPFVNNFYIISLTLIIKKLNIEVLEVSIKLILKYSALIRRSNPMEKTSQYILIDGISRNAQELPKGVEPSFTIYPNPNYRNLQDTKFDIDAVNFLLKTCTVYNSLTEETDFKFIPKKDMNGKSSYAFVKNAPFSLDYSFRDFVPLNDTKTEALYRVLPKGFVMTRAQLVEYGVLMQRRYDYLIAQQEYKAKQEAKFKVIETPSDIKPYQAPAIPFAELQQKAAPKAQKPLASVPVPKPSTPKPSATNPAAELASWPSLSAPADKKAPVEVHVYHADQLALFVELVKKESERGNQSHKKAAI